MSSRTRIDQSERRSNSALVERKCCITFVKVAIYEICEDPAPTTSSDKVVRISHKSDVKFYNPAQNSKSLCPLILQKKAAVEIVYGRRSSLENSIVVTSDN